MSPRGYFIIPCPRFNKRLLFLVLLAQELLVLSLELGIDLGTLGGLIAVQLGLYYVRI